MMIGQQVAIVSSIRNEGRETAWSSGDKQT